MSLNPDDIDIYETSLVVTSPRLAGSANSIGGQTVVIKLRWGLPASKLPLEAQLHDGSKFALGEIQVRISHSGRPPRYQLRAWA